MAGTVAEAVALARYEKDASLSDMAFDVFGMGLAGGGYVIGQGLKTARLADGPEAHAAAKAIWRTGTRNFFKLSDSRAVDRS